MQVYNFIVGCGKIERSIEIWALCEDDAINIVRKEYPESEGWGYILM